MRKKAIIEDIDGPLYPHKQRYIEFFRQRYDGQFAPGLIEAFEQSNDFYYISDFVYALGHEHPEVRQLLELHGVAPTQGVAWAKDFMRKTMYEFGDSEIFTHGKIDEINDLNGVLRRKGIKVIGATSRAIPGKPDDVYTDGIALTNAWRAQEGIEMDAVYYSRTKDKYKVLQEIKRDFLIEPLEVLCVLEDVASALPGFMDEGIPCIMIDVGSEEQRQKARDLLPKYAGFFHKVQSHRDACLKIQELYMQGLRFR